MKQYPRATVRDMALAVVVEGHYTLEQQSGVELLLQGCSAVQAYGYVLPFLHVHDVLCGLVLVVA